MQKLIFAAAALALTAAPAFAAPVRNAPAQAVSTAGVDFRDPAAVKDLYTRLRATARVVCDSNSASPIVTQRDKLCVERAVADAVRTADRPLLTALYDTNSYSRASR